MAIDTIRMRDIFAPWAMCLASASSFLRRASGMRIFGASEIGLGGIEGHDEPIVGMCQGPSSKAPRIAGATRRVGDEHPFGRVETAR